MIRSALSPDSTLGPALASRELASIIRHAPSACTFIVPTKRYRSLLLRTWARERPGADLPTVQTTQQFVLDLARTIAVGGRLMADEEADLLLRLAMDDAGEQFRPPSLTIQRLIRWKQEQHTVASVADRISGADTLDEQGLRELTRILRVWAAYESRQGAHHADRGDVFQRLCAAVREQKPTVSMPLLVLATHGLTAVDEDIYVALAECGWDIGIQFAERGHYLGEDRSNEAGGRLLIGGWSVIEEEPRESAVIIQHECASPRDEVRRILGALKQLSREGVDMAKIAVVVPTGGPYATLLRELARQAGIPLLLASSRSLATTADATAVYSACHVVTRAWQREDVTRLALSGHFRQDLPLQSLLEATELFRLQGGLGPSSWKERLVASREALQNVREDASDDDRRVSRSLAICASALYAVEALERILAAPEGHLSAATFCEFLTTGVIDGLGVTATPALLNTITSYQQICLRHELPGQPLAKHLERWWSLVRAQKVEGDMPGGVAVIRSVDARMGDYTWVFAPGFTEGLFPERRQDSVEEFFLPEAGGMLDAEGLQDILYSASGNGQITITRCTSMDGDDALASVFWDDLAKWQGASHARSSRTFDELADKAPPILLDEGDKRAFVDGPQYDGPTRQHGVALGQLSGGTAAAFEQALGKPVNPSRIDAAAGCPYKYFGTRVLGLGQDADVDEQLTPLERGSLMHAVAQEFMQQHQQQQEPLTEVISVDDVVRRQVHLERYPTDQLMPALERVFHEQRARLPHGYLYDAAEEQAFFDHGTRAGLLRRWLDMELEAQREEEAFFPILFELQIEEAIALPGNRHENVKLRVDRIDARIVDGQVCVRVVDYKTSEGASTAQILAGDSTQMPLYMVAVEQWFAGKGLAVRVEDAAYHVFGKSLFSDKTPKVVVALRHGIGPREKEESVGQLERAIPGVIAGIDVIRGGQFPVSPTEKACAYCHLNEVCRVESWGPIPRNEEKLDPIGDV